MQKVQDQSQFEQETEGLREKMDELRQEKLDCFKLCFRVKVADAILWEQLQQKEARWKQLKTEKDLSFAESEEYRQEIERIKEEIDKNRVYIISFIKSSPEIYESIRDG